MSRPRVFLTRKIFQSALDRIGIAADMDVWQDDLPPPRYVLLQKVKHTDGILTMLSDNIDAELMDMSPSLKVISNMAVGYDNVDVIEAAKRGIPVGYTPGVLTETTADLAFSLLLAAARRVVEADKYTRNGQWRTWGPMMMLGQDIHHATLGIIGLGRIGKEVARRAAGFDMKILYFSRTRKTPDEERKLGLEYTSRMPDLLSRSDFISINVPLTAETYHLIGPDEFALMKSTACIVNTSRGAVIDQQALYTALKSGKISSAAIDVFDKEPIPVDDPLLALPNITITPHIGSASFQTRTKMSLMAADNLLAGLRGDILPNCVNP
ncbi:MAG: D-glycerate dehydrogenase [Dehalococcoidales bacterium]|nr:D-glycerate dehydrogenase [Dehalococcoidales bacterium]